jgi:hypothetical protein
MSIYDQQQTPKLWWCTMMVLERKKNKNLDQIMYGEDFDGGKDGDDDDSGNIGDEVTELRSSNVYPKGQNQEKCWKRGQFTVV